MNHGCNSCCFCRELTVPLPRVPIEPCSTPYCGRRPPPAVLALDDALRRFVMHLDGGGRLVEQPFVLRSSEGMDRCYLSGDRVVGFSEHACRGLAPSVSSRTDETAQLSSGKTMYGSAAAAFRGLRVALEMDWLPAMQRGLQLEAEALPAIWDVDFLRGPIDANGGDT